MSVFAFNDKMTLFFSAWSYCCVFSTMGSAQYRLSNMAKLYFYFSTMNAGKSTVLLQSVIITVKKAGSPSQTMEENHL